MTTYKEAASAGFNVLACQYSNQDFRDNFWFGGNTLHTCLNYLIKARETDFAGVLITGYKVYAPHSGQSSQLLFDHNHRSAQFLPAVARGDGFYCKRIIL